MVVQDVLVAYGDRSLSSPQVHRGGKPLIRMEGAIHDFERFHPAAASVS